MPLARVRGPGHPDVLCDVITTMIVEEYLRRDPETRLRLQVSGGHESLFISGEVLSQADFDVHPLVARALAAIGVAVDIEPFVQFAPAAPAWFPAGGVREPISVNGYATGETESGYPLAYEQARKFARRLEQERTKNADWFWLGPDYDLVADDREKCIWLQVEHLASETVDQVRERILKLFGALGDWRCQINSGGDVPSAGMAHRFGSSGQAGTTLISSQLPLRASGVGHPLRHPTNLGAWLLQKEARRLVRESRGKAVMLQATWLPIETQPALLTARNERGEDLSSEVASELFDLAAPHEAFTAPGWLLAQLRSAFDESKVLPWEE